MHLITENCVGEKGKFSLGFLTAGNQLTRVVTDRLSHIPPHVLAHAHGGSQLEPGHTVALQPNVKHVSGCGVMTTA